MIKKKLSCPKSAWHNTLYLAEMRVNIVLQFVRDDQCLKTNVMHSAHSYMRTEVCVDLHVQEIVHRLDACTETVYRCMHNGDYG